MTTSAILAGLCGWVQSDDARDRNAASRPLLSAIALAHWLCLPLFLLEMHLLWENQGAFQNRMPWSFGFYAARMFFVVMIIVGVMHHVREGWLFHRRMDRKFETSANFITITAVMLSQAFGAAAVANTVAAPYQWLMWAAPVLTLVGYPPSKEDGRAVSIVGTGLRRVRFFLFVNAAFASALIYSFKASQVFGMTYAFVYMAQCFVAPLIDFHMEVRAADGDPDKSTFRNYLHLVVSCSSIILSLVTCYLIQQAAKAPDTLLYQETMRALGLG